MSTAFYKTEKAEFEFSPKDIDFHIKLLTKKHSIEKPSKLYVLLDLIAAGKGSATCKVCGKKYQTNELKPVTVGHGRSPFDFSKKMKGGVKGIFAKKQRIPLYGGIAYECPANHELISAITWRT